MWSYVRKKLKKKCLEMGSRHCRLAAAVVRVDVTWSSGLQSLSCMYVPHQCHLTLGIILVFQNNRLVFGRQQVDFRLVFRSFLCELRNLA